MWIRLLLLLILLKRWAHWVVVFFFFPDVYAGEWWCLLSGGETINQYTRWGESGAKHLQLRTGFQILFLCVVHVRVCVYVSLLMCTRGIDQPRTLWLIHLCGVCWVSPVADALKVQRVKNPSLSFAAKRLLPSKNSMLAKLKVIIVNTFTKFRVQWQRDMFELKCWFFFFFIWICVSSFEFGGG